MEEKDLMIGDWVLYGQRFGIIKELCNGYVTILCSINGQNEYVKETYDNIEPIPLTQEILEKYGFKKYNELYRLDVAEGVFVNADFKSKEPFVSIHNACYRATPICWYLHQLQHALKLCGIKKEIEL